MDRRRVGMALIAGVLLVGTMGSGVHAGSTSPQVANVYPDPPPNFAHPGSPHTPLFDLEGGLTPRSVLTIVTTFTDADKQLAPHQDESWFANRMYGPALFDITGYFEENSFEQLQLSPAMETRGTANDGVIMLDPVSNGPFMNPPNRTGDPAIPRKQNQLAIQAAAQYVDFEQFDLDGNDVVTNDELAIVHTFIGAGASNRTVESVTVDGVTFNDESLVSMNDVNINRQTWIHELGHTLTHMRDLYGFGVGAFALAGPSGVSTDFKTFHANSWEKMHLGWINPTVVTRDGYYEVTRLDRPDPTPSDPTDNQAFILYDPAKGTQHYFIVEVRKRDPDNYENFVADDGLMIWRIDERDWADNNTRLTTIMRPDGTLPPMSDAYGGSDKDAWDASEYQTSGYRAMEGRTWGDGTPAPLAVRAIGSAGRRMRVFFDVIGPGVLVDCYRLAGFRDRGTSTIHVPVRNTGETADTFNFNLTDLPAGWSSAGATRTLGRGASATVPLQLTIPDSAQTSGYQLRVRGESVSDGAIASSCPHSIRVGPDRTALRYTGARQTSTSGAFFFEARARDLDFPSDRISGALVRFRIEGNGRRFEASGVTDQHGVARVVRDNPLPEGDYTLSVRMPRAGHHQAASQEGIPFRIVYGPRMVGRICVPELCGARIVNPFDPVSFRGLVRPSDRGQIVRFTYRRLGTKLWHPLGELNEGKDEPFETRRSRPLDKINRRDRFSIRFQGEHFGQWVIRATFLRQDGQAPASVERVLEIRRPAKK